MTCDLTSLCPVLSHLLLSTIQGGEEKSLPFYS